ncbi:hypothetical protein SAMN05444366_1158 [Flavobacterium saccharophilum]|uniref:Uncharacterized protein n=1 Tax=Flavobacterium saccharophilum TaxID=29534 RepID=A0A1M7CJQ2_9FLAO|nr:hypothetical protein SAMN05444366_1158 [Flavobacterium saccharophilum]
MYNFFLNEQTSLSIYLKDEQKKIQIPKLLQELEFGFLSREFGIVILKFKAYLLHSAILSLFIFT